MDSQKDSRGIKSKNENIQTEISWLKDLAGKVEDSVESLTNRVNSWNSVLEDELHNTTIQ